MRCMEAFLHKFSLQNCLRQFFCGVVFFVPMYLFAKPMLGEFSNLHSWTTGTFLLFASLSGIIGTIVYHLEKNIYSYFIQTIFELLESWKSKPLFCLPCAAVLVISLVCSPCFHDTTSWCCVVPLIIFLLIVVLICWLFTSAFAKVQERTRECWYCEEKVFNIEPTIKNMQVYAIAKRVSAWSDFIHCTQSCCFAWLFGCLACKIHHGSECTCCFNRLLCQCQECFDDRLMSYSVVIALCILVLELVFDWHRYQHVIKMTEMSGLYNRSSLFKNK